MNHVVTGFLRHSGEVLLVRRSDNAVQHPGLWSGLSRYLEAEPDDGLAEMRAAIRDQTEFTDVDLVRAGAPLTVPADDDPWMVHAFLFDVPSRSAVSTSEISESSWVPPTTILDRETVPMLWKTYERVAPSVDSIRTDGIHGASWLSIRALDVLRDEAATTTEWSSVASLAEKLVDARPGMVALGNRVNRVLASVIDEKRPDPAAVHDRAVDAIQAATIADRHAAQNAAKRIRHYTTGPNRSIATISRSGTVLETIRTLASEMESGAQCLTVLVGESRPDREGIGVAESLAESGIDVTVATDAAVPWLLERLGGGGSRSSDTTTDTPQVETFPPVGCVVVGADSIDPTGGVYNKAGTYGLALAADSAGVPLVVVAASAKVSPTAGFDHERSDPAAIYGGTASIEVAAPRFDRTPSDLITAIITEDGVLSSAAVQDIAREHRSLARWKDRDPGPNP